jgi:omega-hydroxy-beta-dihydromenaquinone-9 sulfotransferase
MFDRVVPTPAEAQIIWDYMVPDSIGDPAASVSRIREVFEAEHRHRHKPFMLGKPLRLPIYARLALIQAAYPDTRFVHIVRDGRAVAFSIRGKFVRRGQSQMDALMTAAERWSWVVNAVQTAAPRERLLELRYEDFCGDVHGTLRRIHEFAGMAERDFPFLRCPPRLQPTNTRWMAEATRSEMDMLNQVEGELLSHYGYAL